MLQPKQESRFEYKEFPCVILFMPMGYRCGYVGLPKENRYYKKKYDDIPVDCHCGLSYSGVDYLVRAIRIHGGLGLIVGIPAMVLL